MIFYILLSVSTLISLAVAVKIWRAISQYKYRKGMSRAEHDDLPSVSVCIAARNEMHALTRSLEAVLASDYEKLEVLVLDDNSSDETPFIIKSFAHAGVRFIAGRPLPNGWLGRNHAYQTLAMEASGDFILYLDVDTFLGRHTITQLVEQCMVNQKDMISVLPRRIDALRASALFGTLRYMWELLFATRTTPPSSSAVWMIRRNKLLSLEKSLQDYPLSVRPEQHIARSLQQRNNYAYVIANRNLAVSYEKRWHSQVETAERLYYPLFGRSLLRGVIALLLFISLLIPITLFYTARLPEQTGIFIWACALHVFTFLWFSRYVFATHATPGAWLRTLLWPYLLAQESVLYLLSIFRYVTKTATWKGRPILAQPANNSHYELNE